MAKRTRAARGPSPRRYTYTPELLASGRARYEESDETITAIAADFGVHKTTFQRMANRLGWLRHVAPARDLPVAARLAAEAEALAPAPHAPPHQAAAELPPVAGTVARLHAAVLAELAAVEAMRASLKDVPQKPADAALTARTLASLTDTLHKLQRLQCAAAPSGLPDHDMPADIDEFRRDLARRIDAFVASRTESRDDADGDPGTEPLDEVR